MNSDHTDYGGSGLVNDEVMKAEKVVWHGQTYSLEIKPSAGHGGVKEKPRSRKPRPQEDVSLKATVKEKTARKPSKIKGEAGLKLLFATSECGPYIKTGGLADVIVALPKSLRGMGEDIRVVLPKYRGIPEDYRERMTHVGKPGFG